MKLSEAIRLGAMLRPQGYGAFLKDGVSCAIGAAYEAVGAHIHPDTDEGTANAIWLLSAPAINPCNGRVHKLGVVITTLNDQFKWTREQIADWVATIEPQDAPVEQPVAVLSVQK